MVDRNLKSERDEAPSVAFDAVRFETAPGMTLAGEAIGPIDGHPVLLVHGIGQTRGAWTRVAPRIAEQGFRVTAIDLRGHGASDWCQSADYTLDAYAQDVRAVIGQLGGSPLVVGASLGGLSTVLASGECDRTRPAAIALIDIVPWIDATEGSHVREFMRGTLGGFDDLSGALDAVQHYLPHRPRPQSGEGLLKNLRRGPDHRLYWHWDPQIMAPRDDWDLVSINARLQAAAQSLSMPLMLVRGTKSEIVSDDAMSRFRTMLPQAEIVEIEDARHMVVGDDNGAFLATTSDFLARHAQKGHSLP